MKECKKCGASLKLRKGRLGHFWGCSNFPDCKYTEDCVEGDIPPLTQTQIREADYWRDAFFEERSNFVRFLGSKFTVLGPPLKDYLGPDSTHCPTCGREWDRRKS